MGPPDCRPRCFQRSARHPIRPVGQIRKSAATETHKEKESERERERERGGHGRRDGHRIGRSDWPGAIDWRLGTTWTCWSKGFRSPDFGFVSSFIILFLFHLSIVTAGLLLRRHAHLFSSNRIWNWPRPSTGSDWASSGWLGALFFRSFFVSLQKIWSRRVDSLGSVSAGFSRGSLSRVRLGFLGFLSDGLIPGLVGFFSYQKFLPGFT